MKNWGGRICGGGWRVLSTNEAVSGTFQIIHAALF